MKYSAYANGCILNFMSLLKIMLAAMSAVWPTLRCTTLKSSFWPNPFPHKLASRTHGVPTGVLIGQGQGNLPKPLQNKCWTLASITKHFEKGCMIMLLSWKRDRWWTLASAKRCAWILEEEWHDAILMTVNVEKRETGAHPTHSKPTIRTLFMCVR